jgi:hypothetical protein
MLPNLSRVNSSLFTSAAISFLGSLVLTRNLNHASIAGGIAAGAALIHALTTPMFQKFFVPYSRNYRYAEAMRIGVIAACAEHILISIVAPHMPTALKISSMAIVGLISSFISYTNYMTLRNANYVVL